METASLILKIFRFTLNAYYQNAFDYCLSLKPALALLSTGHQKAKQLEAAEAEPPLPLGLSPDNMTAEWLTHVFQTKGLLSKDNRIVSFELSSFGELGQMSSLYRLTVQLERESNSTLTPSSVIVKANDRSVKGRVTGSLTMVHEIEHGFFRELSNDVQTVFPHPEVYFQAYDAATENGLLIMQEIQHIEPQQLGVSLSVKRAKSHLSQVAALHARYWQDTKLTTYEWLGNNSVRREQVWGTMMKLLWSSKCKARLDSIMSPRNVAALERFVHKSDVWCQKADSLPFTLLHGDMNPFNLLVPQDENKPIVTVDWQTVIRGNWSQDVAYFFMGNLDPEMRKAHEVKLLEHYRQELGKHGVHLKKEELVSDMVLGNTFVLVYFIMSFSVLEPTDPTQLAIMNYFTDAVTYILDKDDTVRDLLESL